MSLRVGKTLLVVVDAGLILYWIAVGADLIPREQAFRDYTNPIVQAWNWSFFPLDVLAATLGFVGVYLMTIDNVHGRLILTVGLTSPSVPGSWPSRSGRTPVITTRRGGRRTSC